MQAAFKVGGRRPELPLARGKELWKKLEENSRSIWMLV